MVMFTINKLFLRSIWLFLLIIKDADEYTYFIANHEFAINFVIELISKLLIIEIIPDILIETVKEMNYDQQNFNTFRLPSDRFVKETRNLNYLPDHITHYDGKKYDLLFIINCHNFHKLYDPASNFNPGWVSRLQPSN